ncbi:hypothetical protein ACL6C3_23225 [Capilliphycus salinus ALCB114379]|uniref:hypothetical protein n=1 Tax=Capilliphycus salinus TaxID=2768948 RepID=UPI0039A57451
MILKRLPNILIACILALSLLVSGCGSTTTSAPPTVGQPTSGGQTVAAEPVSGGQFNKFFPKTEGDYQLNFRQEKTGFAQAKLSQGGQEVALLSINDTANNPAAASKFENSTKQVAGYPAMTVGNNSTAILVADRYQVKVSSQSLSESDREKWLTQFNLTGLARVK